MSHPSASGDNEAAAATIANTREIADVSPTDRDDLAPSGLASPSSAVAGETGHPAGTPEEGASTLLSALPLKWS